tara:strand:+ start:815 stop:1057 length:243 start_codon:yes stop_codon:yes gene_type:complete
MNTSGFVIGLKVYWDLILIGTAASWFLNFALLYTSEFSLTEIIYYATGFGLTSFLILTLMGCVYIPYKNSKKFPEDFEDK